MSRLITEGLRTICGGPFSFSLERGECVALSGPSGCGKTLLLRALADLDPTEGSVRLDGEDRDEMPAPLWRRQVGWLPAESSWWFDRVGEHFGRAGGMPAVRIAGVPPALSKLGALGFEPDVLEWRVERLSTGERQRLALFRLLWNEPKVLLLDEPTASLDVSNVRKAEELIADYRRSTGAAVLWVSHDPEQIAHATDRQLQFFGSGLEAGR